MGRALERRRLLLEDIGWDSEQIEVELIHYQGFRDAAAADLRGFRRRHPGATTRRAQDWDIWPDEIVDGSYEVREEVMEWLEDHAPGFEFYDYEGGCLMLGFRDRAVAFHFKMRWA